MVMCFKSFSYASMHTKDCLMRNFGLQIMETHNVYIFWSTQLDLGIFIYLSIYLSTYGKALLVSVGRERKSSRKSTMSPKKQQQQPKESATAGERSTGPVDRRAQHAQRSSGRQVRSTAEGEQSTARSTD